MVLECDGLSKRGEEVQHVQDRHEGPPVLNLHTTHTVASSCLRLESRLGNRHGGVIMPAIGMAARQQTRWRHHACDWNGGSAGCTERDGGFVRMDLLGVSLRVLVQEGLF